MDLEERLLTEHEAVKKQKKQRIVPREAEKEIKKLKSAKRIKIITGPRRAGKSTLLIHYIVDEDTYYVNFDDEVLSTLKPEQYSLLITTLVKTFGKRNRIVLDEVQNIEKWELFVNRLHRQGYDVYVTGSNSKLLKTQYATKLTGRTLTIELFPFSFKEFLYAKNIKPSFSEQGKGMLLKHLEEYLIYGGFPEVVLEKDKHLKLELLKSTYQDILWKDVVLRKDIKEPSLFLSVANTVCSNIASRLSYRRIARHLNASPTTIAKYLSFLEEAYFLFSAKKFSYKHIEVEGGIKKWFVYDTGMHTVAKLERASEFWRYMENAVALHLKRKGREVFYYLAKDRYEVDIISDKIYQVFYDKEGVPERERNTALKAKKELNKSYELISWYGTESKPLYRFLLE